MAFKPTGKGFFVEDFKRFIPPFMRIFSENDGLLLLKAPQPVSLDRTEDKSALHRDRLPVSAGQMEWKVKLFYITFHPVCQLFPI